LASAQKLYKKLLNGPASFTWAETVSLLKKIGYTQLQGEGSRVRFYNENFSDGTRVISLHRPHPNKEIGRGAAKSLQESVAAFFDGE